MPFNLTDAAKGAIPPDLIIKAAGTTGEAEQTVSRALDGAICSLLIGMLVKNAAGGATSLLKMVRDAAGNNNWRNLNCLAGSKNAGDLGMLVKGWLRSLFGDRLSQVTEAIAGFSGSKSTAVITALNMAAAATLGALGGYVLENKLTAAGLSSFLTSQQQAIIGSMPSGLNLPDALHLQRTAPPAESSSLASDLANEERKRNAWLWLVTLLVAILLIWLLSGRGCGA